MHMRKWGSFRQDHQKSGAPEETHRDMYTEAHTHHGPTTEQRYMTRLARTIPSPFMCPCPPPLPYKQRTLSNHTNGTYVVVTLGNRGSGLMPSNTGEIRVLICSRAASCTVAPVTCKVVQHQHTCGGWGSRRMHTHRTHTSTHPSTHPRTHNHTAHTPKHTARTGHAHTTTPHTHKHTPTHTPTHTQHSTAHTHKHTARTGHARTGSTSSVVSCSRGFPGVRPVNAVTNFGSPW